MNKKLLFTAFASFVAVSQALAQITLLSTDMTSIGDYIERYTDTIPTYSPGASGPGVTWDFSAAVNDTIAITNVVTVASTGWAGTFGSSDYAMQGVTDSYLFFTHDANSLTTTGAAGDLLNNGDQIESPFSDPLILHQFPRTYGSHFDDTYAFITEASGAGLPTPIPVYRIKLTHTGHVYDTTDAYGTLITPTGTYDALRVKSVDFTTDVIEIKLFAFSQWTEFSTSVDTSVSYSWHAKEEKLAIAEFAFDSIGNPARFTYSSVPPVVTTGIAQADENSSVVIYPQPAIDQLCMASEKPLSNAYAQIFAMDGKMVLNNRVNGTCLNVSELRSGMYILCIASLDGKELMSPRKFVKE